MKFSTVYDGEKAIVINYNGEKTIISGPKRVFLLLKKIEKLKHFVANSTQYLSIKYLDGKVVHRKGPATEWLNRFEHESIQVHNAYRLNESQILVVYNRSAETFEVIRRVIDGPCLFVPEPNEWLHQFVWHAQDTENVGHLIQNADKFQILTIKPDFFHYNVKEVRTLDDTLITIKLMVIYELKDIFTMLDKTQDPIADFINAICADIVSFVAKLTFAEFLNSGAQKLNQISTYEQLLQRAERNGYKIESVIYNGYSSTQALQEIQDNAIQSRTQLRLNAEIDEQKNRLIDLKLKSENERLNLETELNKLRCEFDQKIGDLNGRFSLEAKKKNHETELKMKEIQLQSMLQLEVAKQAVKENYLKNLKKLEVDINKYENEVVKCENKIDRLYELIDDSNKNQQDKIFFKNNFSKNT